MDEVPSWQWIGSRVYALDGFKAISDDPIIYIDRNTSALFGKDVELLAITWAMTMSSMDSFPWHLRKGSDL